MRYVICIALFSLFLLASPRVQAASYPDQGQAWAACQARLGVIGSGYACFQHQSNGYRTCQASYTSQTACNNPGGATFLWPTGASCSSRTGDGDGPAAGAFVGDPSTKVCHNGCEYGIGGGSGGTQYNFSGQVIGVWQQGTWQPSGDVCSTQTTPPVPPEEQCVQQGNLTQCVRKDGRHCTKASTGKMFCWQPNEAGTKTDGNEAATKSPVDKPNNPPPIPPANNGNWEQSGQGNVSITNNNGNTTTYNNTNYTSSNGPQGSGGSSTNPDGTDNDPDGEGGSSSGGGDCATPYQCSGDPVICSVGQQSYLQRCGSSLGDANGDGRPDWTDLGNGEGDDGPQPGSGEEAQAKEWDFSFLLDRLDSSGFIGGSCPAFPVVDFGPMGTFAPADMDWWCNGIAMIAACFMFAGACIAIVILVS